jgi:signal transduction histidine kinase
MLVVAIGAIAATAIVWRAAWLSAEWRIGVLLGVAFLAVAAVLGRALLGRSRRDLVAVEQLLRAATGDLTHAYEELTDAHGRLRETSRARDDALTRLQAAVRDREVFLASIAHDLKSPLTVVKGHTDLLAAHVASGNPLDAGRIAVGLARIASSTQQLTAMVDELLWLAQLDVDRAVERRYEATDLVQLARRVVDEQSLTAPRHQLRFSSSVPTLVGIWDPARLERVATNLLSNAVKYSPVGGDVRVSVAEEDGGAIAVLSVADNGVGIPAADLPHVFERFFRAENVEAHTPGTGLGLASVRQIVEGMAGSVALDSREGVGTMVTVRIPTQPPRARPE